MVDQRYGPIVFIARRRSNFSVLEQSTTIDCVGWVFGVLSGALKAIERRRNALDEPRIFEPRDAVQRAPTGVTSPNVDFEHALRSGCLTRIAAWL